MQKAYLCRIKMVTLCSDEQSDFCDVMATQGNLLWLQAKDEGADKRAHPRSLISAFVIRSLCL